jgi:hypothetical protein
MFADIVATRLTRATGFHPQVSLVQGGVDDDSLAILETLHALAKLNDGSGKLVPKSHGKLDSCDFIFYPRLRSKNRAPKIFVDVCATDATEGDLQSNFVVATLSTNY